MYEIALLKTEIQKGLIDLKAGRVTDFDVARIVANCRKLLARCTTSICSRDD